MKARKIVCPYCYQLFYPSPFHPKQTVCLSSECQRRRRNDYHRNRITTDSDYRQTCIESWKKWQENNPDYHHNYISRNQAYTKRYRQKQRERNQKRKLSLIVRNNSTIDLKQLPSSVWITGPGLETIVKNNLAISQIFIFQTQNESGQMEIYVRSLTQIKKGRWQIPTSGGNNPLWSPDAVISP